MEITVKVIEEAGYNSATYGLSLNKNQKVENMFSVAEKLAPIDGGHNKFLEQIYIWLDVNAPRYWWQEADTYRLSSKSSQSTMHTILKNKLVAENFEDSDIDNIDLAYLNFLLDKEDLLGLKKKLPEGFMQRRMWCMSYKTLKNIILQRKNHRLPHWKLFIATVLSEIIHPELLPSMEV